MDTLALYRRGRYGEALAQAQQLGDPKAIALALLAMGESFEAQTLLEAWQPSDEAERAERLALLGFAANRKGDYPTYRRLAVQAAAQAPTPLTLYHLGLSLPPKDGLLALQGALYQLEAQGAPLAEQARLSYALARSLRRLGRFEEALAYASLAALQAPGQPHYRLEELTLLAYSGEEPLAELERALPPWLAHEALPVRYQALWLSLLLQGMQGRPDPGLLQSLLAQTQSPHLPYDLPLLVRLFKGHPSADPVLSRWLRAAAARLTQEPLPQALLAQGLRRYPHPDARTLLEESLPALESEWAEEALRAVAHLVEPCLSESTTFWKATHARPEDFTLKKRYLLGVLEEVVFYDRRGGEILARLRRSSTGRGSAPGQSSRTPDRSP